MAYGCYLTLDQPVWVRGDFSSTDKLSGTIYTDKARSTTLNLTGSSLTVRIFKRWHNVDYFSKVASIVSAANGTWSYVVARGELPQPGIYLLKVELSSSGIQISTFPEEFEIIEGPHA